jgi:hypothetical protein
MRDVIKLAGRQSRPAEPQAIAGALCFLGNFLIDFFMKKR